MDHPRCRFSSSRFLSSRTTLIATCVVLLAFLITADATESFAKRKYRRRPRPEPELRILALNVAPTPYVPSEGPLRFEATVQLPKNMADNLVLEVSSLVASPSKTSLRFLSDRQAVTAHLASESPTPQSGASENGQMPTQVQIQLTWDGTDQHQSPAQPGAYAYEVRAKLLTDSEKGQRTWMVSWPKRGKFEVK